MATSTWVVELDLRGMDNLTEDYLVQLDRLGDEHEWMVTRREGGSGLVMSAWCDGPGPDDALLGLLAIVRPWLAHYDVQVDLAGVQVRSEEQYERDALAPSVPELLAATDVAEVLGVTRQRVHQLAADHPRFPDPVVRTGAGPLWTRPAIDWFSSVWERRPGRPRGIVAS